MKIWPSCTTNAGWMLAYRESIRRYFEQPRVPTTADEAQMALCHLDFISTLPGVHPHRVAVIRGALERLARL
jgi:hypothetical protein